MRILEICVDLDGGGIDRYLLNYCSRIEDIHFDFVCVDKNKEGVLEKPIKDLGCNIYKIARQSSGTVAYYKALKKIMTENTYDAVHMHLGYRGMIALFCAKRCKIKCRISHAHIAFEPEGRERKVLRKICTVICKSLSTHLAGCGVDAAKWLWGVKEYESGKVKIHNNAIDGEKFKFSQDKRVDARDALGLSDDTLAVGHVGRLCEQKNQIRLVEIFAEIKRQNENSMLFMVGRGEMEKAIVKKVEELGLSKSVRLLGIRDDVDKLLNAFDVFVFPSTHEGLPFTLIETQCNGLYALSADTVTPFVKVSPCVEFISLEADNRTWAEKSLALSGKGHNESAHNDVVEAGYDINAEAEKLRQYYIDCIRECNK